MAYNYSAVPQKIIDVVDTICKKEGVPFSFMMALIATESGFNVFALRYEPFYGYLFSVDKIAAELKLTRETIKTAEKFSYGLTQIMLAVAYERGFNGYPGELYSPRQNILFACQHLNWLAKKWNIYRENVLDWYAAYNAGRVERLKTDPNQYINQKNVMRFKENYF